jgi:PQQ-dependent dehydrogenase (methanol/ethanol family)
MKRKIAVIGPVALVAAAVALSASSFTLASSHASRFVNNISVNDPTMAGRGLAASSRNANEWLLPARTYSSWRYSPLAQINTGNARNLRLAWTFSLGTTRGLEGQPVVAGHMMYIVSSYPNWVYAIDLNHPGVIKWRYVLPKQFRDYNQKSQAFQHACCDVVTRGLGYGAGRIFLLTLDGHVIALNAKNGHVLWSRQNSNPNISQTGTMAPLVVHNKVIVGMSGGEYGVRGFITAYNIYTGKRAWRFYTTGPDSAIGIGPGSLAPRNKGISTWVGNQWQIGGSAPWSWVSYDPKLNLIYHTTGNPGTWNPSQRPGDNKWSMSVFARNPDTGAVKWAFQFTPHDQWDYDATQEQVLVNLRIRGRTVPALVHFDKNGFAWVLNRANGHFITAHKYEFVNYAYRVNRNGRLVLNPRYETREGHNTTNICPAAMGSKDEQPVSFDPQTGLFYVPTNHLCMDYQPFHVTYHAGQAYVGAIVRMYNAPGGYGGSFEAYNALTGRTVWRIKDRYADWSGALTTGGGLAFYGTMTRWFRAVDARSGRVLFQVLLPSGIIGNPIAYSFRGKEYVAIYSGLGGWPAEFIGNHLNEPTAELGAVNEFKGIVRYSNLGGDLFVFSL